MEFDFNKNLIYTEYFRIKIEAKKETKWSPFFL